MSFSFANDGFEITEGVLDCEAVEPLRLGISEVPRHHRGGARNLLRDSDAVAELAMSGPVKQLADAVLGAECFPVRALFFDKAPAANWKVPWHQDTVIAVAERIETPGFTGWSQKDGVPHVCPPAEILEQMVALRIHLDDCGAANGPLRVLPGSHREGKLNPEAIRRWRQRVSEVVCCVGIGGVLMMRPLLLHASSPAQAAAHRRVVHIEYASEPLPSGLRWFETTTEQLQSLT